MYTQRTPGLKRKLCFRENGEAQRGKEYPFHNLD